MKKIITLCLLAFIGITTLSAQTIWNDGSLTFTKTSPGQFEAMTSQTHITRGSSRPLYNSVTEASANNDQCWNPGNTEWAEGNIDDWSTLTYSTIGNVVGGCGFSNISNRPYVLHLISENIYLQITFTYWQQGGGDFTYTRATHTGCFTKSKTFASICQGQSYSFNGSNYTTTGTYTKTLTNTAGCDSTATLNLTVNPTNTVAISEAGSALMLDGSNDYATIPRAISGDFTYEYWMKTTSISPTGINWYSGTGIVDAEVGGVTNDFGTSLLNNKLAFGTGNPDVTIKSTTSINTGQWVHVAVTRKQATGELNLYINGILEASGTGGTGNLTAPSNIKIGIIQTFAGNYLNGSLDELRFWSVVKTPAEILASMHSAVPTNSAGLVAYYKFDEVPGSTVLDATGNSNTGSLVNGATLSLPSYAPIFGVASQSLLINTPLTNMIFVTTGATGLGTAIGLPAGVSAVWANNIITISGTPTQSGVFNYSIPLIGGCSSVTAAGTITVTAPTLSITGASSVCAGSQITLSATIAGGVWSTQATSQATINSTTGLVTAKNAGTISINYSKTGFATVTKTLTINPIPSVPTITYAPGTPNPQLGAPTGGFCVGKVFTVVGMPNVPAGLWSATGFASITSSGVVSVNGVGAGSIKYTYTSAAGCSNSRTMLGTGYTCASRGLATNSILQTTNEFSMYPNPAKGSINLNVETLIGKGSIVVTDLCGKTVKTQALSMGTNTVDIANLSKGMYFVSMLTNEGKTTKKLVVE